MHTIYYETKHTSASTDYIRIEDKDRDIILRSLLSLNSWFQELSLSGDKEIKEFFSWYQKPNRKYPYNTKLKKHNSPQSMISGLLNNIMFGEQRDLSLIQAELIQDINNTCIDIIEVIQEEKKIDLQKTPGYQKIWLQVNIWA